MSVERVTRTARADRASSPSETTATGRTYRNVKSARVGIQVYGGPGGKSLRELRPPAEVFAPAALQSMDGAPYIIGHGGDPTPRGKVVNPRRAETHIQHEIEVPAEHVDAVERAPAGLSWEYTCELAPPDPTLADVYGEHDAVQTNIRATALSAVDFPRCGASCARTKSDSAGCTCGGACSESTPATNPERTPNMATSNTPSDTTTQDSTTAHPNPVAIKEEIEVRGRALPILGEKRADWVFSAPLAEVMDAVIKERDPHAPLARLDGKGMNPDAAHAFRLALFHRALTAPVEVTPTARAIAGEQPTQRADASALEHGMTAHNSDALPSTSAAQARRRYEERLYSPPARRADDVHADASNADAAIAARHGWPPGMTAFNTDAYPSPNAAIAKQRLDARTLARK